MRPEFSAGVAARTPNSRYLRDYPVDVPWEDPELIEVMVALRHQA